MGEALSRFTPILDNGGVHTSTDDLASFPADLRHLPLNGLSDMAFAPVTELVSIDSLVLADSPRLSGEDAEHVRRLAEAQPNLPPILVHRETMRVIDGWHRIRAAAVCGRNEIEVRFVEGPESSLFILAVGANIRHGLPLSLAEREAAAARLIALYPVWSDRTIAGTTGLAPSTVATIRRQQQSGASSVRLGRDGRIRPLDATRGRRIAAEIISHRPTASLREIAKEAGISPATVRDVRLRMERGDDRVRSESPATRDVAAGEQLAGRGRAGAAVRRMPQRDPARPAWEPEALLQGLRSDPSLRLTDTGRAFLRWFLPRVAGPSGFDDLADAVPPHSKYVVARLARNCADKWQKFADLMEQQASSAA